MSPITEPHSTLLDDPECRMMEGLTRIHKGKFQCKSMAVQS